MKPRTVPGFGIRKLCPTGPLYQLFIASVVCFLSYDLPAQCALSCRGKINLSLADSCAATIQSTMLLTDGINCPNARYRVDILDYAMKKIPTSPVITREYMKKTVIGMVYDSTSRNSCWTKINVEDKFGPVILCKYDTLYCNDTTIFDPPIFYDWCDSVPVIQLAGEDIQTLQCDPDFIKILTRYWTAYDAWGNRSPICTSKIWFRRIPLDSILFPKDFAVYNNCHLECGSDFLKDTSGHPHPSVTGVPTLNGHPLWPDQTFYCNTGTGYEDIIILVDDCKKKIMRRWRIVEWYCGGARIRTHLQTIEIVDTEPPHLHCPYDLTVTTAPGYVCEAFFYMPPADVFDSCQQEVFVEMYYAGGLLASSNGGNIRLPVGVHYVIFRAHDKCHNEDTCQVKVTVVDQTPPVAVCDQHTVVALTRDDEIHVYAESFDDGSYDECHIDSFLVRRMDLGANCGYIDTTFRPYVRFCCADVGRNHRVILRVKDKSGNYNECMVLVEVQDKTPPVIRCPHDYRIPCSDHIDTTDFSKFGQPVYSDNCIVTMTERIDKNLDQCGLGSIDRIFIIVDNMGRIDSCRQRIFVFDPDPFDEDDIIWPKDFHMESCGGDFDPKNLPDSSGYPIFLDNPCSLIGVSFTDHVFNYIQDTSLCFKVLRKWKVIDWCQCYHDSTTGEKICPTWHWDQVIKISNKLPPKISDDCDTVIVCLADTNCLRERVRLTHTAFDDCSADEDIISSFKLDLYNNGLFDTTHQVLGNQITWDGFLPIGEHRFLWIFNDQCGNQIVCTQIVRIVNCKPPTAYCLSGVAVNLMGVDLNGDGILEGQIDVWASDLDHGSFQQCGNPVTLSFSRDTTDKYRRYTCDSLGMRIVQVWVTDQYSGKQDFCRSIVIVQDNNNICKTTITTANIAGIIKTPFDDEVPEVTIIVDGPTGIKQGEFNGKFNFNNLTLNSDYHIRPIKDKHYLDGISTLDIIKIQKHILATEEFDSPWKRLAGDVTGDKKITTSDISALRRLILGVDTRFSGNLSWKFIDAGYKFPIPSDPWVENLPEVYTISQLSGHMMFIDFVGIKVGDVSQTTWGNLNNVVTRSSDVLQLNAVMDPDRKQLHFQLKESIKIKGLQMALKFDPMLWDVQDIIGAGIPLSAGNISLSQLKEGIIKISWNTETVNNFEAGDRLFSLNCSEKCFEDSHLSLSIDPSMMKVEAYGSNDQIMDIQLVTTPSKTYFGSLNPNPFNQETQLMIGLKTDGEIEYQVYDLKGKIIYQNKGNYQFGLHKLTISSSQLSGPGVYALKIRAGSEFKSFKLVSLAQ